MWRQLWQLMAWRQSDSDGKSPSPPAAVAAKPIIIKPITVEPIAARHHCRRAHCRTSDPPMIKVVDINCHMYGMKRSTLWCCRPRGGGGGGVSDRLLKEYKFRAGIAKHDLVRKATG